MPCGQGSKRPVAMSSWRWTPTEHVAQRDPPDHLLLDHGFDFVKGSRFVAGGGSLDITPLRKLGNRALLLLANHLFETQLTDSATLLRVPAPVPQAPAAHLGGLRDRDRAHHSGGDGGAWMPRCRASSCHGAADVPASARSPTGSACCARCSRSATSPPSSGGCRWMIPVHDEPTWARCPVRWSSAPTPRTAGTTFSSPSSRSSSSSTHLTRSSSSSTTPRALLTGLAGVSSDHRGGQRRPKGSQALATRVPALERRDRRVPRRRRSGTARWLAQLLEAYATVRSWASGGGRAGVERTRPRWLPLSSTGSSGAATRACRGTRRCAQPRRRQHVVPADLLDLVGGFSTSLGRTGRTGRAARRPRCASERPAVAGGRLVYDLRHWSPTPSRRPSDACVLLAALLRGRSVKGLGALNGGDSCALQRAQLPPRHHPAGVRQALSDAVGGDIGALGRAASLVGGSRSRASATARPAPLGHRLEAPGASGPAGDEGGARTLR